MDQTITTSTSPSSSPSSSSVLETLGEEILRIVSPVTLCMLLVVLLVSALSSSDSSSLPFSSIASMVYSETPSDSFWSKLSGAFLNSIIFVVLVTILTFVLVLLFYLRCTPCLKSYMAFSSFVVLSFFGGEICLLLLSRFSIPMDAFSFLILLFNFSVVGVLAVFLSKMPISINQGYLVAIGVLVAYWFTLLPEWTTWALLVAMALYDLAAVLLPFGPLRLLVELAISRDEDIPALVYEARPVQPWSVGGRRLWRERTNFEASPDSIPDQPRLGQLLRERRVEDETSAGPQLLAPLIPGQPVSQEPLEGVDPQSITGRSGSPRDRPLLQVRRHTIPSW
ncbi:Presenilin-like protein [Apostasia shenzhenica]|uniref:Presenilin n=1 Tax=Apostasia shenzhenica TaxID=1088818 RepID=A0A2I0B1D9_9ASPA|nr:Presenilin-like protein [Apostasia shenzhenica]